MVLGSELMCCLLLCAWAEAASLSRAISFTLTGLLDAGMFLARLGGVWGAFGGTFRDVLRCMVVYLGHF